MSEHVCAGIGHRQLGIYTYHCQHDDSFHVWITTGTCDEPFEGDIYHYGPFDSGEQVMADAFSQLWRYLAMIRLSPTG